MTTTRKFPHLHAEVDTHERAMIAPVVRKYDDVDIQTAHVRPVRLVGNEPSYRTTLAQAGIAVDDDRYFAFGLKHVDLGCAHNAENITRFGYARCAGCNGHLWCAGWVAEGVFGDGTVEWANESAGRLRDRLAVQRTMQRVTVGG